MKTNNDDIFKSIIELQHTIMSAFYKRFLDNLDIPDQMNQTHIRTLHYLAIKGSTPMHKVSKRISLEKGSFTPVAKKLIELGYIVRIKDANDKRISFLELTDAGKKLTDGIHKLHSQYVEEKTKVLTGEEKELLISGMNTLTALMKKCR